MRSTRSWYRRSTLEGEPRGLFIGSVSAAETLRPDRNLDFGPQRGDNAPHMNPMKGNAAPTAILLLT